MLGLEPIIVAFLIKIMLNYTTAPLWECGLMCGARNHTFRIYIEVFKPLDYVISAIVGRDWDLRGEYVARTHDLPISS